MIKASELLLQSAEPFDKACVMVREMEEELVRLREMERDAIRYRWLRDHCTHAENPHHVWIVEAPADVWDDAVDEAMAEVQT